MEGWGGGGKKQNSFQLGTRSCPLEAITQGPTGLPPKAPMSPHSLFPCTDLSLTTGVKACLSCSLDPCVQGVQGVQG